jgi:Family of unknown function (DUF5994)
MTTIRRTRLPARHAVDAETSAPRTADTPRRRAGEADPVRLSLIDPPAERTTLDGAWWPRTRSLSDELPGLVQELHRRGVRVTRVAYNPEAWEPAPRRLAADGRIIRLGWFRSIDPQLLDLTGDSHRGRLDLLVIPPDTSAAAAEQACTAAVDRTNRRTPTALLAALHPTAPPMERPRADVHRVGVGKAAPPARLSPPRRHPSCRGAGRDDPAWWAQAPRRDSRGGRALCPLRQWPLNARESSRRPHLTPEPKTHCWYRDTASPFAVSGTSDLPPRGCPSNQRQQQFGAHHVRSPPHPRPRPGARRRGSGPPE